ncbi:MAG: NosD domain-containing protein [Candidatus Thermoplasmatota archaeon]
MYKKNCFVKIGLKRTLVLLVLINLILTFSIPIFNQNYARAEHKKQNKKILYVGGTRAGNYSKIQTALENASNGYEIFVYNGTYTENLIIEKSVILNGESKNTTIIEGKRKDNVIEIKSSSVKISNFTIKNSGKKNAGILICSENNVIKNNEILENNYGIQIKNGTNNHIKYNAITSNLESAIQLEESKNNSVYFNKICYNCLNSTNFTFKPGLSLKNSTENVVYENFFLLNQIGLLLFNSNQNSFFNNYLKDEKIGVRMINSSKNNISNNIFEENRVGTYLYESKNNIIERNCIQNSLRGIYIEESKSNTITKNHLTKNIKGIFSSYATSNVIAYNNLISNDVNAEFIRYLHTGYIKPNRWKRNYYDTWPGIGFKIIPGAIVIIPEEIFLKWFNLDLNPAEEPYDI